MNNATMISPKPCQMCERVKVEPTCDSGLCQNCDEVQLINMTLFSIECELDLLGKHQAMLAREDRDQLRSCAKRLNQLVTSLHVNQSMQLARSADEI